MPLSGTLTRSQLADRTQNPSQTVAGLHTAAPGLTAHFDLVFQGVAFKPEDVFDALEAKYGGTAATLSTNLTGANNDLTFTARQGGQLANATTIRYVDPAGNNAALSVSVSTQAITVNLATDGGGAITSTAATIRDAINGSSAASALVFAANKAANDGTGVVTAMAATALSGGAGKVQADTDTLTRNNYRLRVTA